MENTSRMSAVTMVLDNCAIGIPTSEKLEMSVFVKRDVRSCRQIGGREFFMVSGREAPYVKCYQN